MKKEYKRPEIKANVYAEFENVLTFACTKQYFNGDTTCHTHPEIGNSSGQDPCDDSVKLSGQSDWPCAHEWPNSGQTAS